jgi:DNA-binding transcriptional ArsR family regulator
MAAPLTADVFRAVSDPTRRRMLELLGRGERSAAELAEPFDMTQPAVSQHLKVLRDARLVRVRKDGRSRIYALEPQPLREVFDWAQYFEGFWKKRLSALGARLLAMED